MVVRNIGIFLMALLLLAGVGMITWHKQGMPSTELPSLLSRVTGLASLPVASATFSEGGRVPVNGSYTITMNPRTGVNGSTTSTQVQPTNPPGVKNGNPFNGINHIGYGADASKLHITTGVDASINLPPAPGPLTYHIADGPHATEYDDLVHVAIGPDKTKLVRKITAVHGEAPSPDATRYFPGGWKHNNIPGPLQTLYVGPDWEHWKFSSHMGPPANNPHITAGPDASTTTGHIAFGPDATNIRPRNPPWKHINDSPDGSGQDTLYVAPNGPGSGSHINIGPDETLWVPGEHRSAGANQSVWAPGGWEHVTAPGPQQTTWHPPGWEHQTAGPKTTEYMPPGTFHATESPPGFTGDPGEGIASDATSYLPPGTYHVTMIESQDKTLYVPPGWAHAAMPGGGQWPAPGVGLWGVGTNFMMTNYIPPTVVHDGNPASADESRYIPTGGTFHGTTGPDLSHQIPNDWQHVAAAGSTDQAGNPIEQTRYIEPDWQHHALGQSPSQYTPQS